MARKLLLIPFVMALLLTIPSPIHAESAIEVIDNDFQEVVISYSSSKLHVTGANGQTLHIYNVAGVCVMSIKVDGPDRQYDLSLSKGCYIVKVGKTVRKISVK